MSIIVPYQLKLTGGLATRHQFEAYDGYLGMAGFARTLSLVSHYVETGKIRQKKAILRGVIRSLDSLLVKVVFSPTF